MDSIASIRYDTMTNCTQGTIKKTTDIFSLVVAICATVAPSGVHAEQYGSFTYSSDGTAVTIQRYHCSAGKESVVIPDMINGLPVTKIGREAFFRCNVLISIGIPNSVTNIGRHAFLGCAALTRVTNISDTAFIYCDNLTRVYIAGDELAFDVSAFLSSRPTIHYLAGTLGWDESYWDRRIALWTLPKPTDTPASRSTDRPRIPNLVGTTHAGGVMDAYARWVHPVWYDVGTGTRVGGADAHAGSAKQCRENLRKIYRAIDQYAMEHAKSAGDEITAQAFATFAHYVEGGARRVIGPGGGEYAIPVLGLARCSLEAHALK